MSIHSLESERELILQRMQMSRNGYRHMLMDDTGADHAKPAMHFTHGRHETPDIGTRPDSQFPRSVTMRLITEHPLACALAVTALVVIGPRRMVRVATRGSTRVTDLALRNRANIDLIGRVVAMAAQYMQRNRASSRR